MPRACLVSCPSRQLVRLERIEVATTGYARVAYRIAARARRDETAGKSCEQRLELTRLGQLRVQLERSFELLAQPTIVDRLEAFAVAQEALQGAVGETRLQPGEVLGYWLVFGEAQRK